MNRLIENTVFSGLVIACRLATCPTRISPSFVNPTTDGVSRLPSWFAMTVGLPPYHGDHGVRCSEIDADHLRHVILLAFFRAPALPAQSWGRHQRGPSRRRRACEAAPSEVS